MRVNLNKQRTLNLHTYLTGVVSPTRGWLPARTPVVPSCWQNSRGLFIGLQQPLPLSDVSASFCVAVAAGCFNLRPHSISWRSVGTRMRPLPGQPSVLVENIKHAWYRWHRTFTLLAALAAYGCPFMASVDQSLAPAALAVSYHTWSASYMSWYLINEKLCLDPLAMSELLSRPSGDFCVLFARPISNPHMQRAVLRSRLPTIGLTGNYLTDRWLWWSLGVGSTSVLAQSLGLALIYAAIARARRFYMSSLRLREFSGFLSYLIFSLAGFISRGCVDWVLTTNHKRLAILYFLFIGIAASMGLTLATIIRLELAYPGTMFIVQTAERYLTLISLHGIVMVFFVVIPLLFGAFANFLLPLQLGVRDVAFPRLNSFMFWLTPSGLVLLMHIFYFDRVHTATHWLNYNEQRGLLRRRYLAFQEEKTCFHEDLEPSLLAWRLALTPRDLVESRALLLRSVAPRRDSTPVELWAAYRPLPIRELLRESDLVDRHIAVNQIFSVDGPEVPTGALAVLQKAGRQTLASFKLRFDGFFLNLLLLPFFTLGALFSGLVSLVGEIYKIGVVLYFYKMFLGLEYHLRRIVALFINSIVARSVSAGLHELPPVVGILEVTGMFVGLKSLLLTTHIQPRAQHTGLFSGGSTPDRGAGSTRWDTPTFILYDTLVSSLSWESLGLGSDLAAATAAPVYEYLADWRSLRLERETWRSLDILGLARSGTQPRLYSSFFEPSLAVNHMNAWLPNKLIPGWAFITPYTSRLRYTALGKVDIALIVVLMASLGSVFSAANYLITYRYLGAPLLQKRRELRSFFVDALLVASRMMVLANPALILGIVLLLSDRHLGTSVFDFSGGGDTILFQHLFWFFGHPEVYIIMIPCFGFMNSLLPAYLRKRLSGRLSLQFSIYTIALMGFAVWGHHMYMVGLANSVRTLYSTMTVMISVPASTKVLHWCVTLVQATWVADVGFFFLLNFLYFFVLGGLSGMFVAHIGFDVIFHDTFYVIGHFHVMLAAAAISACFAAFYFYFSAIFGVRYSRGFAYLHYAFYTAGQLLTLTPMFWLGYSGMPRRVLDYPTTLVSWHSLASSGHLLTVVSFILFIAMLVDSFAEGRAPQSRTCGVSRLNTRLAFFAYEQRRLRQRQQAGLVLVRRGVSGPRSAVVRQAALLGREQVSWGYRWTQA